MTLGVALEVVLLCGVYQIDLLVQAFTICFFKYTLIGLQLVCVLQQQERFHALLVICLQFHQAYSDHLNIVLKAHHIVQVLFPNWSVEQP